MLQESCSDGDVKMSLQTWFGTRDCELPQQVWINFRGAVLLLVFALL
jgi:hypothetical protein